MGLWKVDKKKGGLGNPIGGGEGETSADITVVGDANGKACLQSMAVDVSYEPSVMLNEVFTIIEETTQPPCEKNGKLVSDTTVEIPHF